jgi:hypothetical protein
MRNYFLFLLLISILFSSCDHESHDVVRSFCFWKTTMSYDSKDDSLANNMKLKHFYVRYFDVDYNPFRKQALPLASIQFINFNNSNIQFTPSVFITNDVVLKSTKIQLDTLANRICIRVNSISDTYFTQSATTYANEIANADYEKQKGETKSRIETEPIIAKRKLELQKNIQDILIDCDWSEKSKDNYFYLLKQIKNKFPNYKIEATIRLWQYKYFEKTGIPPVDSGLLMCYNMTNPESRTTENSIGTNNDLEKYIVHDKYKLKLNIALPLYSWSLVFRGDKFKGILSNEIDFTKDETVFKKSGENKFILQDDIRIGNMYLRNGDEIRIEKISNSEIENMISTLNDNIKIDKTTRVTFFSFDKKYINDYGTQNISNYFTQF